MINIVRLGSDRFQELLASPDFYREIKKKQGLRPTEEDKKNYEFLQRHRLSVYPPLFLDSSDPSIVIKPEEKYCVRLHLRCPSYAKLLFSVFQWAKICIINKKFLSQDEMSPILKWFQDNGIFVIQAPKQCCSFYLNPLLMKQQEHASDLEDGDYDPHPEKQLYVDVDSSEEVQFIKRKRSREVNDALKKVNLDSKVKVFSTRSETEKLKTLKKKGEKTADREWLVGINAPSYFHCFLLPDDREQILKETEYSATQKQIYCLLASSCHLSLYPSPERKLWNIDEEYVCCFQVLNLNKTQALSVVASFMQNLWMPKITEEEKKQMTLFEPLLNSQLELKTLLSKEESLVASFKKTKLEEQKGKEKEKEKEKEMTQEEESESDDDDTSSSEEEEEQEGEGDDEKEEGEEEEKEKEKEKEKAKAKAKEKETEQVKQTAASTKLVAPSLPFSLSLPFSGSGSGLKSGPSSSSSPISLPQMPQPQAPRNVSSFLDSMLK